MFAFAYGFAPLHRAAKQPSSRRSRSQLCTVGRAKEKSAPTYQAYKVIKYQPSPTTPNRTDKRVKACHEYANEMSPFSAGSLPSLPNGNATAPRQKGHADCAPCFPGLIKSFRLVCSSTGLHGRDGF